MSESPITPRTVAIELTRTCHRSCIYCYNRWKDPSAADGVANVEPEPDRLAAVIDAALAGKRFLRADLTGGEPMSRPDFFDILDRVSLHCVRPAVITDGGLIGPSEAQALARRRIALVQITILSTDRAKHDFLKGGPSLDAAIRAITLLVSRGVRVSAAFICTRMNHDQLADVLRLCRALGVRSLAFSRLCTAGEALSHREDLWPDSWMVASCLARLHDLGRRYRVRTFNAVAVPHCVWPDGGRCAMSAGIPNFTVDLWGLVRPCSVSSTVLGKLPDDDWNTIAARYRGSLLPDLAAAVPDSCGRCERLPACLGGCRESGRASAGRPDGMDPLADEKNAGRTCQAG